MPDMEVGESSNVSRSLERNRHNGIPTYQYEALEATQVRLIRLVQLEEGDIGCAIEAHNLEHCPEYYALSYTWGAACRSDDQLMNGAADRTEAMMCNNNVIFTTRNLYDAFQQLQRSYPDALFWIDAICINQEDQAEKAVQILKMGEIYAKASRVIVWLGLPDRFFPNFLWVIQELSPALKSIFFEKRELFAKSPGDPRLNQALGTTAEYLEQQVRGFFETCNERRWFSRIWTLQESAHISKTTVLFPASEIPFGAVVQAGFILDTLKWRNFMRPTSEPVGQEQFFPWIAARQNVYAPLDYATLNPDEEIDGANLIMRKKIDDVFGSVDGDPNAISWLVWLIILSKPFECTNPRDKVFAIFGLLQQYLPKKIKELKLPDYSWAVEKILIEFARTALTGIPRLVLLSLAEDPSARKIKDIPSWVPEYNATKPSHTALLMFPNALKARYDAMNCSEMVQAERSIDETTLICQGAEFDTVVETCGRNDLNVPETSRVVEMLRLCCLLPEHINGAHRLENLWRTLTGNISRDRMTNEQAYPACESLGTDFKHWLEIKIALQLHRSAEEDLSFDDIQHLIHNLDPLNGSGFSPDKHKIKWIHGVFGRRVDTMSKEFNESWRDHDEHASRFGLSISLIMEGRRLFTTAKGFLGMGSVSTSSGDRIVFLRDSTVPFVLRKRPNADDMTVVSDCYLHGFMNGEVLEDKWGLKDRTGPIRIT